jgi:hypothetical protein
MAKRKKKDPESLDFLEENSLSSKALDEIMHYVNALDSAQAKVERLEGELEEAKKVADNIAKKVLPEMLLSAGFETLGLANGKKIEIKEEVYVNVPKDPFKKRVLFNWMKQQGAEYLIRKELKVDDPSEELMNELSTKGVSYDKSENVNVNSFKAFIREGLGLKKGSVATFSKEDVPSECNLFINREAKVSG